MWGCLSAAEQEKPAVCPGSVEGKLHPGGIKPSSASPAQELIVLLSPALGSPRMLCAALGPTRLDVKLLGCTQRRATELVKGWERMSCGEPLRILGSSGLEKRRLSGDLIALQSFLGRGRGDNGNLLSLGCSGE
ncbi:hypothetical protein DUI87_25338 [Hirundo rustica rustica]|uniref:Uncharacterized protein n=1 Tax=Hirundo rustica rustica TaxID=333673 RepID=A0A3M0JC66_HIRRU|nr:hypothetical protein DUI87_25338 [Hirundo rustica rustica]